jgi:hypothetical protein
VPAFSGRWLLDEAPVAAAARGQGGPSPQQDRSNVKISVTSGAAFNCGERCILTLRGQTLTISEAQLGTSRNVPVVQLELDGTQRSVVDSFNPARSLPVTAELNAGTIRIRTSGVPPHTQTLSIESNRLTVLTEVDLQGVQPIRRVYRME